MDSLVVMACPLTACPQNGEKPTLDALQLGCVCGFEFANKNSAFDPTSFRS